jgi:hypothetical protein
MSEKPEKKERDLTFSQMYDRLNDESVPEKVSGTPVCRSERVFLEGLNEQS